MSRRGLLAAGLVAALSSMVFAGESPKRTCCMKPEKAATGETLKCSITGKTVDKCCCVEREGKTYCTLAGRPVEKCCCDSSKPEEAR